MCNTPRYSESGACLGVQRCNEFVLLKSDRDRLAGVVAGMEEQNARNLEALRRAEAENARLREALDRLACRSNRLTSNFRHGRQSTPADFTRLCNAQFEAKKVLDTALKEPTDG